MVVFGIFLIDLALPKNQQAQINTKLLVTRDTLKQLPAKQEVIIDTRSKIKFLMGHIPGAINLSNWKEFTSKNNRIRIDRGMLFKVLNKNSNTKAERDWLNKKLVQ